MCRTKSEDLSKFLEQIQKVIEILQRPKEGRLRALEVFRHIECIIRDEMGQPVEQIAREVWDLDKLLGKPEAATRESVGLGSDEQIWPLV